MNKTSGDIFDRRDILKASALAIGGAVLANPIDAYPKAVNTNSSPSTLKITDLRVATVVKPGPSPCPIIRIDTNQGVSGLGEVRDGASPTYALFLKSRILGENPLQLDKIFRKIKQFGGPARQAGGVCAVEMALWDIAGKVYNVPVYVMLGGKVRDKLADTPGKTIFVRADARAQYRAVEDAIDAVRTAGVDEVGLLTQRRQNNGEAGE